MKRFFEFVVIILIGNNLLIANGLKLVGNVLMRSLSFKNEPGIPSYDLKDACDDCKLGMCITF